MLPNFDWPAIIERQRRELEFLTILADGGNITVNGMPWRVAFAKINRIVGDPVLPFDDGLFLRDEHGRFIGVKRRSAA